jgi:hypothetical protein
MSEIGIFHRLEAPGKAAKSRRGMRMAATG